MFRYEIKTPNLCEAEELLRDYECTGGNFSCSENVFRFEAEFKDQIPPDVLRHYNSKPGVSIREIRC